MNTQGVLIVLDGADGSGKATQTRLLVEKLQSEGREVQTLDFPQYTQNMAGRLIRECLDGKRGDFMHTDARIASMLYAVDRFESKKKLKEWLGRGAVVVLDRYVSANMMHQGAKIADTEEVKEFLTWLDELEYGVFQIPRPDIIIYLDVPLEDRMRMVKEAVAEGKENKGTSVDVAESDMAHQYAAGERAKEIVRSQNNWRQVVCTKKGSMRTREDIHEEIYELLKGDILAS